MEQTLRHLCATHNLTPDVFNALVRATFFSFTPQQLFWKLCDALLAVVYELPYIASDDEWCCYFGNSALRLRMHNEKVVFYHETNVGYYARREWAFTYYDVFSIKAYLSKIPLELILKDESVPSNLSAFMYNLKWTFHPIHRGFDGKKFSFKNASLFTWRFGKYPLSVELVVPGKIHITQCIYNNEILEDLKELIKRITV